MMLILIIAPAHPSLHFRLSHTGTRLSPTRACKVLLNSQQLHGVPSITRYRDAYLCSRCCPPQHRVVLARLVRSTNARSRKPHVLPSLSRSERCSNLYELLLVVHES
mmetsp:Transcript_41272/g.72503  ORF Transcript_41272/g.72503 Transcript_41272/m.72503 type:complete len:107 (-) Transcript_41272:159-479(-)